MKKVIMYALFVVFVSGSAFANNEETVSNVVKQSFLQEFAGAQAVSWESLAAKDLYHASFIYNNERLNAYFNGEGKLIATGRYVKVESLPLLVSKGISSRFTKFSVVDVIELTSGTETSYIVSVENDKQVLYVQAYNDGSTSVIKKEKKK